MSQFTMVLDSQGLPISGKFSNTVFLHIGPGDNLHLFTFAFIHEVAFIQSDLQLLYMSEVARLWSN